MPPLPNIPVKMIRKDLENIPTFPMPPGFSLRWYRPGDKGSWLAVHHQSERYVQVTPNLYDREFGNDHETLAARQAFLVDSQGKPVGTASAWSVEEDPRLGRVHWVAIVPEVQGHGLAKPLLSAVLMRLRELGHERAMLSTATMRVPAINLYLKFGFMPAVETEEQAKGWRAIGDQLIRGGGEGFSWEAFNLNDESVR